MSFVEILCGNLDCLTWVTAALPIPTGVCSIFVCPNNVRLAVFWIFNNTQMLMHVISHRDPTDTVKESALQADSERKIPWCTWDSNLHQYCTWFFSRTLYKLSYSTPLLLYNLLNAELSLGWRGIGQD